jgi:hypothetical protein
LDVQARRARPSVEYKLQRRVWLDEHGTGLHAARALSGPIMTAIQGPADVEYLRRDLLNRMDALPLFEWSPALLRALIAVFDLNRIAPELEYSFRPYIVR